MEKYFKYFFIIVVVCLVIGIFIANNAPKPAMTAYDEVELRQVIASNNSDLPRKIGTIGTLDSITCNEKTITYNLTVFGDNGIKEIYKDNYNEFGDLLKYSLLTMNGQRNMGNVFASILDSKGLNLCCRIFTQDGDNTQWTMTGAELKDFVESCKMNPSSALNTTIDMQIKIANLHLPVNPEDFNDPIKTVAINTIFGDMDKSCLPQYVAYKDDNIIFCFSADEDELNLQQIEENDNNPEFIDACASSFTEDADAQEFLGIVAISHSNMVIIYEGRKSHKSVSITIPYEVLKKYCKVPQYLLS